MRLSGAEKESFCTHGFVGPFELCTASEMAAMRAHLEALFDAPGAAGGHNGHQYDPLMWRLASHPAIAGRMQSLYGPELLVWRTNFFVKDPSGGVASRGEIPWHQDVNFWPLEPAVIMTAWIAVTDSTEENGLLQLIPGSHRCVVPHVPSSSPELVFQEMADPEFVDLSKVVSFPMRAGQFILFNERTMHHSNPNTTDQRRLGLAVRVGQSPLHVRGC